MPEYIFPPDADHDEPDFEAVYMCLTDREETIISMLAEGEDSNSVARSLGVSINVVWQAQDRANLLVKRWHNARTLIESV